MKPPARGVDGGNMAAGWGAGAAGAGAGAGAGAAGGGGALGLSIDGLMGAFRVLESVLWGGRDPTPPPVGTFHWVGKLSAGSAIYSTFVATWARFWKKLAVAVWPCWVVW